MFAIFLFAHRLSCKQKMEKIEYKDGKKFWVVLIDPEEVFVRVSLDSNYREHAMEGGEIRYVMLDDDIPMFNRLVKNAIAELWMKLGRMSKTVDNGIRYTEDITMLRLEVGANHDDNMLFTLGGFIGQFIDAWVLKQWFGLNGLQEKEETCARDAASALSSLVTVVHYRKKAVKRPIHPIF